MDAQSKLASVEEWLGGLKPWLHFVRLGLKNNTYGFGIMAEERGHEVRRSTLGVHEDVITGGWSSDDIIGALDRGGAAEDLSIKGSALLLHSLSNELIVDPWDA